MLSRFSNRFPKTNTIPWTAQCPSIPSGHVNALALEWFFWWWGYCSDESMVCSDSKLIRTLSNCLMANGAWLSAQFQPVIEALLGCVTGGQCEWVGMGGGIASGRGPGAAPPGKNRSKGAFPRDGRFHNSGRPHDCLLPSRPRDNAPFWACSLCPGEPVLAPGLSVTEVIDRNVRPDKTDAAHMCRAKFQLDVRTILGLICCQWSQWSRQTVPTSCAICGIDWSIMLSCCVSALLGLWPVYELQPVTELQQDPIMVKAEFATVYVMFGYQGNVCPIHLVMVIQQDPILVIAEVATMSVLLGRDLMQWRCQGKACLMTCQPRRRWLSPMRSPCWSLPPQRPNWFLSTLRTRRCVQFSTYVARLSPPCIYWCFDFFACVPALIPALHLFMLENWRHGACKAWMQSGSFETSQSKDFWDPAC